MIRLRLEMEAKVGGLRIVIEGQIRGVGGDVYVFEGCEGEAEE